MRPLIATLVLVGPLSGTATSRPAPPLPPAEVSASTPAVAAITRSGFDWPLRGAHEVARGFDPPVTDYGPGHRGVDLTGSAGRPVLAAGTGVVVYAGWLAGRNVVSIEHTGGLRTTYEPVAADVVAGQTVTRGQPIGRLDPGHPECAAHVPLVCLHWGARRHGEYLNPLRLLAPTAVRLLPWHGRSGHAH